MHTSSLAYHKCDTHSTPWGSLSCEAATSFQNSLNSPSETSQPCAHTGARFEVRELSTGVLDAIAEGGCTDSVTVVQLGSSLKNINVSMNH